MQPVTLTPFEYTLALSMLGVIGFFLKKFSNDIRDKEMDLSRSVEKLNVNLVNLTEVIHRMETWVSAEFVRKCDHKDDLRAIKEDLRNSEERLGAQIKEHRHN